MLPAVKKISLLTADDSLISYTNKTRAQVAEKPGCYFIYTNVCQQRFSLIKLGCCIQRWYHVCWIARYQILSFGWGRLIDIVDVNQRLLVNPPQVLWLIDRAKSGTEARDRSQ